MLFKITAVLSLKIEIVFVHKTLCVFFNSVTQIIVNLLDVQCEQKHTSDCYRSSDTSSKIEALKSQICFKTIYSKFKKNFKKN